MWFYQPAIVRGSSFAAQCSPFVKRLGYSGIRLPGAFAAFSTDAADGKDSEPAAEKVADEVVEESIEKDLSAAPLKDEKELEAAMGEQKVDGKKKIKR